MRIVKKLPGEFRVGDIVVEPGMPARLSQVVDSDAGLMLHEFEGSRPDRPVAIWMRSRYLSSVRFTIVEDDKKPGNK